MKVFLGGTCNETAWRDELIPLLKIDYFNPVVEDWTPECQKIEREEKNAYCKLHLYVITSEMKGVFSIAEAVQSSNDKYKFTIFVIIEKGFDESELKSLTAVGNLIIENGGIVKYNPSIKELADMLNVFK